MPTIVTVVRGRHDHLRRQRRWIAAMEPPPPVHVVVAMGDPAVAGVLADNAGCPTRLVTVDGDPLPLAAARNAGVAEAERAGATTVVLLDVDCLPDQRLVADYDEELARIVRPDGPTVLCGRVRYLPDGLGDDDHTPDRVWRAGVDHRLRPVPPDGPVPGDPRLLWSLNIGLRIEDWHRIGGFDEAYVGYGGEDTDFGQRLAAAGGAMWWSGRALAHHQFHPVSEPPVEHLAEIVGNVNLFRRKWGFDPMAGWLREFAARGLISHSAGVGWYLCHRTGSNAAPLGKRESK